MRQYGGFRSQPHLLGHPQLHDRRLRRSDEQPHLHSRGDRHFQLHGKRGGDRLHRPHPSLPAGAALHTNLSPRHPPHLRTWHAASILFVVVFGIYLNSFDHGLVGFDDAAVLHGAPGGMGGTLVLKDWAKRTYENPLRYVPDFFFERQLRNLSHLLDQTLSGEDLWGYRVANTLYHFVASFFAFLIAARLLGSRPAGLAAALLFAVHPVQTESVVYLGGRRDVLYGMLGLGSLHLWLEAIEEKRSNLLFSAILLWVLALSAKQTALALPLLGLACLRLLHPWAKLRPLLRRYRGHCAFVLLFFGSLVVFHFWREYGKSARLQLPTEVLWYGGGAFSHWATEPRILLHSLKLLAWPLALSGDYSYRVFDPSRSFWELSSFASLLALAGIAGLSWVVRKRQPLVAFSLLWTALAYAPHLPVFPTLHNLECFAEHWLYLPVLGMALLVGHGFLIAERRLPRAGWALLGVLSVLLSTRTILRNRDWKDDLTFWSKTSQAHPECARAQGALGLAHFNRGRLKEAEAFYQKALRIRPDYPEDLVNLGIVYHSTGRWKQAEETLKRVLRQPFGRRLFLGPVYHNLGIVYLRTGRPLEAHRAFRSAVAAGMWTPSQYGVIHALLLVNPVERARQLRAYRDILSRDPGYVPVLNEMGLFLLRQREAGESIPYFERALSRDPDFLNARINLGSAYAGQGRFVQAHLHLKRAVQMNPDSSEAWLALAQLHRKWGMLPRAREAAEKAVELRNSPGAYQELLKAQEAIGRMGSGERKR